MIATALLATAAAAAAGPPLAPGAPWPEMRLDQHNTARSTIAGVYRGGRPWRVRFAKGIFNTPVIDRRGTAYVGSAAGVLEAIDKRGKVRWRFRTGGIMDAGGVLLADGDLVVGSGDETLYRLRTAKKPRGGRVVWRFKSPTKPATGQLVNWWEGPLSLSPSGDILAGNTGGGAHRITPDGKLRWVHQAGNSVWTAPATADDGTTYWGSVDRSVFALDGAGVAKWTAQTLGFVTASPSIGSDGTVYIASFDGKVYALDPVLGLSRWTYQTRDHVYGGPALAQSGSGTTSLVVIGSADGGIYGLTPSGQLAWRYETGDPIRSSPAIGLAADGKGQIAYAGSSNGRLYAIDVATGRRRWSFDTTPDDPVLRDRNDLNGSPALDATGVTIGGEHGYLWHIPYDYCLHHRDRRCSTSPSDELPADADRVGYVTPGGTTELDGPSAAVPAATIVTGRLVVRHAGATVDAGALAIPDAASLVSVTPSVPVSAQLSGDGAYLTVVPDGFLTPGAHYAFRMHGTYGAGGIPVANTTVGATSLGSFDSTLTLRVAAAGAAPSVSVGPRRTTALEITRLAVPLPPLLPSVNQIGFDGYDLIAGVVRAGAPDASGERSVLLWVIGGRRGPHGRLVADPHAGFAFPMAGRLKGDALILRNDNLTLHFSFGDVPLRRFELRASLTPSLSARAGSSVYAEVTCATVPNYGPLLYITGICNTSGTLPVAGTFLASHYDPSGRAASRPAGVSLQSVVLTRPSLLTAGSAVATLSVPPGYRSADHLVGVLLLDAGGAPVAIDYATLTRDADGPGSLIATVTIPAGTSLPAGVTAVVMADAYPLASRSGL